MKKPWNIVCLGGGTGLPQLLLGLKHLSLEVPDIVAMDRLTVIVTSFDDGGSSGRIVEAYHTLPPGDLRNCLLALADASSEPLLTRFFDHRFRDDEHETLAGHSVGNLLLLTLSQIYGGNIRKAILAIRSLLPIRSTLLFPTEQPATLCALLADGTVVRGESQIAARKDRSPIAEIFLESRAAATGPADDGGRVHFPPMEGVLEAIATADLITLGPGSLYTSVLPHFLVDGIADAVGASPAPKIYISNLMIEVGETDHYSMADHVTNLERQSGIRIDAILANDQPVSEEMLRAYHREQMMLKFRKIRRRLERAFDRALEAPEATTELLSVADSARAGLHSLASELENPTGRLVQVLPDPADKLPQHVNLATTDLLADVEVATGGSTKRVIRHDPQKLARALLATAARLNRGDKTRDEVQVSRECV